MILLLSLPLHAQEVDLRDGMGGAYARLWGSASWEYLRGPVAAGDFDGDGFPDTAVANFNGAAYYYVAGEVQILPGATVSGDLDLGEAPTNLHGGSEHDYLGTGPWAMERDGAPAALLVGADHSGLTEYDQGQVLLFEEPLVTPGWRSAEFADVVVRGDGKADLFGRVVERAADLDGDGQDDWLIGAPGRDNTYTDSATGQSVTNREAGRLWIVLDGFEGLSGAVNAGEAAAGTITGSRPSLFVGWRACAAGDLDGDGNGDLVVGTAEQDLGFVGELHVYTEVREGMGVTDDDATGTWIGEGWEAFAGTGLACGDPDLDGVVDVYVGSHTLNGGRGRVWHLEGAPRGQQVLDAAAIAWVDGDPGSAFGHSLALGPKLLIGAPTSNRVTVAATDLTVEYVLQGEKGFGYYVGWPGDLNGDRVSDVAIVAHEASGLGREDNGVAALLSGLDVANATVPLWEDPDAADGDGDGAPKAQDCDDTDPRRSPLEDEVCKDGTDNDCDFRVDEDPCTSGGCSTGPGAGLAATLVAAALVARRRRWLLALPLAVGCADKAPPLELLIPAGTLSGVVEVSASGNFDQLALLVDGSALAAAPLAALSTDWDTRTVTDGEHIVTAVGYLGSRDPVEVNQTVTVDQSASDSSVPQVRIETPHEGDVLGSDLIPIVFTVNENVGVASVQILANDSLLATIAPEGPYELAWENVVEGEYVLTATATDLAGNVGSDVVAVTVSDIAAVECTITNPRDGSTVGGSVDVTAGFGSSAGTTQVEFFVGKESVAVDTSSPWGFTWDTSPYDGTTVSLRAVCTAEDGGVGENTVTVTIDPAAGLFSTTITVPADGDTVSGSEVPIKAAIGGGENGGPARAEFYVDDVLVGTDKKPPEWKILWDSGTVADGEHVIRVVGYELETGTAAEDSITVNVSN